MTLTAWIACAVPGVSRAGELLLDHWDYRSPSSIGENLNDVIHDGEKFFAVGSGGLMMTSVDGVHWSEANDRRDEGAGKTDFTRIVRAGDAWLALGGAWFNNNYGGTSFSVDGTTWNFPDNASSRPPIDAVYFDDRYLILARPVFLYSVPDLNGTYNEIELSSLGAEVEAIAVGNNRVVIVGTNGMTAYSDNGLDWTPNTPVTTQTLYRVVYLGDAFYAVGGGETILRSVDGIAWSLVYENTSPFPGSIRGIARLDDHWIALAGTTTVESDDGIDWAPGAPVPGLAIAAANGRWVVVGEGGTRLTSDDGVTWTGATAGPREFIMELASSGTRVVTNPFVGRSLTTTDGISWYGAPAGTGAFAINVSWFRDHFYANSSEGLLRSADGTAWETVALPSANPVSALAFADDMMFIRFDDNSHYRSTDGIDWTPIATLPAYALMTDIAGVSGKYAMTTVGGSGFTSVDGASWTEVPSLTYPSNIAFGNGRFVSGMGLVVYSEDGVNWQSASSALFERRSPITFTGEEFVYGGVGGQIAWSPDGITWHTMFTPMSLDVRSVVRLGDTLVAVNTLGTIIQSRAAPPTGGLLNISARAPLLAGDDTLIAGFSVVGGPKALLIRGVGQSMGIGGAISDPQFQIFRGASELPGNDDWSLFADQTRLSQVSTAVFAFSLTETEDAAGVFDLDPGTVTAVIRNKPQLAGIGLAEVFDADLAPTPATGRLVNLSARGTVRTGDEIMIAGFVIRAGNPAKVLVRGVGPALAEFGVTNPLANPQLTIFAGQQAIATNDDWDEIANYGQTSFLADEFGAFALAQGSADAALVLYLAPGLYTAHITSADGTTGTALAEVYLLE